MVNPQQVAAAGLGKVVLSMHLPNPPSAGEDVRSDEFFHCAVSCPQQEPSVLSRPVWLSRQRNRFYKDPAQQGPGSSLGFGKLHVIKGLPGKPGLGEVSIGQLRSHHGLVTELGPQTGQCPIGGIEVTRGPFGKKAELLTGGGPSHYRKLHLHDPRGKLYRLQAKADQIQHLDRIQRWCSGADMLLVPAASIDEKAKREFCQRLTSGDEGYQHRMEELPDEKEEACAVCLRIVEEESLPHRLLRHKGPERCPQITGGQLVKAMGPRPEALMQSSCRKREQGAYRFYLQLEKRVAEVRFQIEGV